MQTLTYRGLHFKVHQEPERSGAERGGVEPDEAKLRSHWLPHTMVPEGSVRAGD